VSTILEMPLQERVGRLLAPIGIDGGFSATPLSGGANNRVFRIDANGSSVGVIKAYFSHPDDPRNRAKAEFEFSTFAWAQGVRSIPEPLGYDDEGQVGLYAYVDGLGMVAGEVDGDAVAQAIAFCQAINANRGDTVAQDLGDGSEACFSIDEHLAAIGQRVRRLDAIAATSALDRDAIALVRDRVAPAWESLSASIATSEVRLAPADRCISPSDFGFHNALRLANGELRFLDFEYAGWDDPAKLVCDFFCQPKVPVSQSSFNDFAHAIAETVADADGAVQRAALLLPAYRLKWACILLNDFLPVGASRRGFADGGADETTRKTRQMAIATQALEGIA
jgi:hypothetical protein